MPLVHWRSAAMAANRRRFLKLTGLAGTALLVESAVVRSAWGQNPMPVRSSIDTPAAQDRLRRERRPLRVSRSSCCTGFPTMCGPLTAWCRRWSAPDTGCWCRICAATVPPSSVTPRRRAWRSRRRSARTSSTSPTRCGCRALRWPATTGAAAPRRSRRRFIRTGCARRC